jgi:hypothetical protein
VLPGAAATGAKMNAEWTGAMGGKLLDSGNLSFQIVGFDLCYFSLHRITGSSALQKNDHSIGLGNGFSFGSHGLYQQIIEYVSFFQDRFSF